MKQLLLTLIVLPSLSGMYTPMEKEPHKEFVEAALSGLPEKIDPFIQYHKKTYVDVLKVCAANNNIQALAYVLPKILKPAPLKPEELLKYYKEKEFHYAKKLCQIIPTSTYLEQNYAPCSEAVISVACGCCVCWADIIAWLSEPTMSKKVKDLEDSYHKEYSDYEQHQKKLRDIYMLAYTKNHEEFLKMYKEYKYQILGIEEDTFNEF